MNKKYKYFSKTRVYLVSGVLCHANTLSLIFWVVFFPQYNFLFTTVGQKCRGRFYKIDYRFHLLLMKFIFYVYLDCFEGFGKVGIIPVVET